MIILLNWSLSWNGGGGGSRTRVRSSLSLSHSQACLIISPTSKITTFFHIQLLCGLRVPPVTHRVTILDPVKSARLPYNFFVSSIWLTSCFTPKEISAPNYAAKATDPKCELLFAIIVFELLRAYLPYLHSYLDPTMSKPLRPLNLLINSAQTRTRTL